MGMSRSASSLINSSTHRRASAARPATFPIVRADGAASSSGARSVHWEREEPARISSVLDTHRGQRSSSGPSSADGPGRPQT